MKGVVFTEFLDFVSAVDGADMVDDIIDDASLLHDGAYTAVGTYPFTEMQRLVVALARRSGRGADTLLTAFGQYLCGRFVIKYPDFFTGQTCLFDFLESVDRHIHVEVHKLYADAELPKFNTAFREETRLAIDYRSCRPLESLAEGMIEAAAGHFKETVTISRARIEDADGAVTRFMIHRAA